MSIAPITGKFRKRFWLDLTTALGLGVSAGYAFWSVFLTLPSRVMPTDSRGTGMACTSSVVSILPRPQILGRSTPRIRAALVRSSIPFADSCFSLPTVQRQEEFYLKLERAKQSQE